MEIVSIGESMVALVNEPSGYIRHAEGFKPTLAGAETNTLIGLSRLGHDTSWISVLGDDELGEFILHKVRAENVDTSHVKRSDKRTGVFFKQIFPNASVDVTYYRENSAASHISIMDIDIETIKRAKILYLTGITLSLSDSVKEMLFNLVLELQNEVKIVFDPNIRLKMWSESEARATILQFLPYVDCLIAGINEMKILLGNNDNEKSIEIFKGYGCENVILKLGKDGAMYDFSGDKGIVKNPKQFKEIDPIGAGDAFSAGVISGLLKKESPGKLVEQACFLGGYITQFMGDYQGFPSVSELESNLKDSNAEKVNR